MSPELRAAPRRRRRQCLRSYLGRGRFSRKWASEARPRRRVVDRDLAAGAGTADRLQRLGVVALDQPRDEGAAGLALAREAVGDGDELAVVAATKDRLTVEKDERRQRALDNLASLNWTLPEDYKFNREEANER